MRTAGPAGDIAQSEFAKPVEGVVFAQLSSVRKDRDLAYYLESSALSDLSGRVFRS